MLTEKKRAVGVVIAAWVQRVTTASELHDDRDAGCVSKWRHILVSCFAKGIAPSCRAGAVGSGHPCVWYETLHEKRLDPA